MHQSSEDSRSAGMLSVGARSNKILDCASTSGSWISHDVCIGSDGGDVADGGSISAGVAAAVLGRLQAPLGFETTSLHDSLEG